MTWLRVALKITKFNSQFKKYLFTFWRGNKNSNWWFKRWIYCMAESTVQSLLCYRSLKVNFSTIPFWLIFWFFAAFPSTSDFLSYRLHLFSTHNLNIYDYFSACAETQFWQNIILKYFIIFHRKISKLLTFQQLSGYRSYTPPSTCFLFAYFSNISSCEYPKQGEKWK